MNRDPHRRVLVTGASGMLGAALVCSWQDRLNVYATDRRDFSGNPAERFKVFDLGATSYGELVDWAEPDVIVHCAAITEVDYCEQNEDLAMAVNGDSVRRFLEVSPGSRMIFISSEAVFPEEVHRATEWDATAPLNVYGRSKVLGEQHLQMGRAPNCGVRTTIVGLNINPGKKGFVEWILGSLRDGEALKLFDDAVFTPISTWHLADELEWIMANEVSGILHVAGRDILSKYDFGVGLCKKLMYDTALISPTRVQDFNFSARRSKDQTLDCSRYESLSGRDLPGSEELFETIRHHSEEHRHGNI